MEAAFEVQKLYIMNEINEQLKKLPEFTNQEKGFLRDKTGIKADATIDNYLKGMGASYPVSVMILNLATELLAKREKTAA